jgi:hypothetical protein
MWTDQDRQRPARKDKLRLSQVIHVSPSNFDTTFNRTIRLSICSFLSLAAWVVVVGKENALLTFPLPGVTTKSLGSEAFFEKRNARIQAEIIECARAKVKVSQPFLC